MTDLIVYTQNSVPCAIPESCHRIWSRFESDRHPNIYFFLPFSNFPIFSTFLFFPVHFKVIKSVYFVYKRFKNKLYRLNRLCIDMKGSVYFENNVSKFLRFKLLCDRRVF
jgi:hypothetical protein